MEEWKTYKLGELADVTKLAGYEFTKYVHYIPDGDIIAIRALNLRDGLLDLSDVQRISKAVSDSLERSKLYYDDIVLSYTGTIGACAIIKEDGRFHLAPNVCKITSKAINADFLYYIIRSHWFQRQLKGFCHGSTQPTIPMKTIRELSVPVPPIRIQERINDLLVPLDAKIRINNLINLNLEEQAQALFKSWFVDFEPFKNERIVDTELGTIPKGWRVGTLKELVDIKYGKDHKKLRDGDIPVYGSGGLMRKVDKFLHDKESVLIPRKGSLNNIMYVNSPFWTVDTMFYTVMKQPNAAKYVHQFMLLQNLAAMNTGSAVPSMTTDVLNQLAIVIPPSEVLESFDIIASSFYELIGLNLRQNERLAILRDTLLPKLMSGEIAV